MCGNYRRLIRCFILPFDAKQFICHDETLIRFLLFNPAEFRGAGKVTFLKGGLAGLSKGPSKFLAMQVAVYLLGLWGIILLFDPAAVVRSSFGQVADACCVLFFLKIVLFGIVAERNSFCSPTIF